MSTEATAPVRGVFSRSEHIAQGYSPGRHATNTLVLAALIGGFGVFLARRAAPTDWLFVPAFFVAANAIEWAFHRGPMHRPVGPRIFYQNHALLHHRAFLHDSMEVAEPRELGLVMMPWYTMLLLFVIASPIAFAAAAVRGWPVAGLFYVTAAAYFLMYETMHALYHLPRATLCRLGLGGPVFAALQAHHRHHHRLERMAFANFNVTIPLMDWLLGTKEPESSAKIPA